MLFQGPPPTLAPSQPSQGLQALAMGDIIQPAKLHNLLGEAGNGKSLLALDWFRRRLLQEGGAGLWACWGSDAASLRRKLLAQQASVPLQRLESGELKPTEQEAVAIAHGWLSQLPIQVLSEAEARLDLVRQEAHRLHESHGRLTMLVVDPLDLCPWFHEIGGIRQLLQGLRALAQELNTAVLLVGTPMDEQGTDLWGAFDHWSPPVGGCDVSLVLEGQSPWLDPLDEDTPPQAMRLWVRRNRNGPLGRCHLKLDHARHRLLPADGPTLFDALGWQERQAGRED